MRCCCCAFSSSLTFRSCHWLWCGDGLRRSGGRRMRNKDADHVVETVVGVAAALDAVRSDSQHDLPPVVGLVADPAAFVATQHDVALMRFGVGIREIDRQTIAPISTRMFDVCRWRGMVAEKNALPGRMAKSHA